MSFGSIFPGLGSDGYSPTRIADTTVGHYRVSTILLPTAVYGHWYETLVFDDRQEGMVEVEGLRHSNKSASRAYHKKMVAKYRKMR